MNNNKSQLNLKHILRNIILFLLILNSSSCEKGEAKSSITDCQRSTNFGNLKLCLPNLEGHKECYDIEKVKLLADSFELDVNQVLGYYLPDTIYTKIDSLYSLTYDNYFKLYTNKSLLNQKFSDRDFKEFVEMINKDFILENWDKVEDETLDKFKELPFNKPTAVKKYKLNKDVNTLILLIKYENNEYPVLCFLNVMKLKNNMFWIAYYKNYKSESSIREGKSKNDYIINEFFKSN